MDEADVEVVDVPERSRYEAYDSGLLGFLTYRRKPGVIVFDHAEVEPDARGRGVAAALAATAMAEAEGEDIRVDPQCSYVRRWIEKNPRYLPIVVSHQQPR